MIYQCFDSMQIILFDKQILIFIIPSVAKPYSQLEITEPTDHIHNYQHPRRLRHWQKV